MPVAKGSTNEGGAEHAEPSMGASDANNGGGSGAGIADAETTMRVGDPAHDADVNADRAKLFPETGHQSEVSPRDQPAPRGS